METSHFRCEVITPMFIAGANGNTPEIRAPSLKGAMRFWWRAAHPQLTLQRLKEEEARLFGDAGETGKSGVRIKVVTNQLKTQQYQPTTKRFWMTGISPGEKFDIYLKARSDMKNYESILKFTLILGGLGKRSRRGFGSVCLLSDASTKDNILKKILHLLNDIGGPYTQSSQKIVLNGRVANANYPYIEEIIIGKPEKDWKQIINRVKNAAHKYSRSDYLGSTFHKRFASPIYVSVVKTSNNHYYPIVTTLHTYFNGRLNGRIQDQQAFIREVI